MKKAVMTVAMLALTAGSAQAALVASWDNNNRTGDQIFTEGGGSAHVTATSMTRSAGLAGNSEANSLSSRGFNSAATYIEFGFNVDSGYQTKLNDLWIGTKSSATGAGSIGVFTSLDNYTKAIYTIEGNTASVNSKIDLSSLGSVSGTFSIRLKPVAAADGKFYDATGHEGIAADSTFSVTNYFETPASTTIDGNTTATPLPAAVWLLGSGLLGLVGVRKKQA
jgi:hypothetical protein